MPPRHLWAGWPCQRPSRNPFATQGWLWSTYGQGRRAEDRSEELFATQGWLWSTCGQGPRAKDRSEELFATPGWLWSTCGQGGRAEQIVRRIIMIEVKVLVGYAPWQMVSGGIGSRKEGPDRDKWSKTTHETLGASGGSEANGVFRNPYHPPGVTIIEKRLTDSHIDLSVSLLLDCIGIGDYSATTSTLRVALTAL